MLAPYRITGFVQQVEFLYAPTSCDISNLKEESIKDFGSTAGIRFYEISVTATDSAGRTGMDTCKVIIVPECDDNANPNNCETVEVDSFHNTDEMKQISENSMIRYSLASAQLTWDFGLKCDLDSRPSAMPSVKPSKEPSKLPSDQPSSLPSAIPSDKPSKEPSKAPSDQPSSLPSAMPSDMPSQEPSDEPSSLPSVMPSDMPSKEPSDQPSSLPSAMPSDMPSQEPSDQPSSLPSAMPSDKPSKEPSKAPSDQPSSLPSAMPSDKPSKEPSKAPSDQPSAEDERTFQIQSSFYFDDSTRDWCLQAVNPRVGAQLNVRPCDERLEGTTQEWFLDSFDQLRLRLAPSESLCVQWKGKESFMGTCDDEGSTSAKAEFVYNIEEKSLVVKKPHGDFYLGVPVNDNKFDEARLFVADRLEDKESLSSWSLVLLQN